jgi:hypothetical protein
MVWGFINHKGYVCGTNFCSPFFSLCVACIAMSHSFPFGEKTVVQLFTRVARRKARPTAVLRRLHWRGYAVVCLLLTVAVAVQFKITMSGMLKSVPLDKFIETLKDVEKRQHFLKFLDK